jgi:hypothetical protein
LRLGVRKKNSRKGAKREEKQSMKSPLDGLMAWREEKDLTQRRQGAKRGIGGVMDDD